MGRGDARAARRTRDHAAGGHQHRGRLPPDALLTVLGEQAPDLSVELHAAPAAQRLQRVRDGEWDAALIRGADRSPGLEFLPLWSDDLVVAVPAGHPPDGPHQNRPRRTALADRRTRGQPALVRHRRPGLPGRLTTLLDACRRVGGTDR
ncbi:LysR substrate-binding domain-containing protein [Streptomyces sp. WM6378]|uniref:LysR substrate-binding domain-containing protein n=1 Tax=Streptomyces sp. WM6378 TaxID=1415557 RepID=UPI003B6387D5